MSWVQAMVSNCRVRTTQESCIRKPGLAGMSQFYRKALGLQNCSLGDFILTLPTHTFLLVSLKNNYKMYWEWNVLRLEGMVIIFLYSCPHPEQNVCQCFSSLCCMDPGYKNQGFCFAGPWAVAQVRHLYTRQAWGCFPVPWVPGLQLALGFYCPLLLLCHQEPVLCNLLCVCSVSLDSGNSVTNAQWVTVL
jgi:hypothetical protein